MRNTQVAVQTDNRGRLLLPKELRQHLGLKPKGVVNVEARRDGTIVLRDARAERSRRLRAAQGSLASRGRPVSEFLAERRANAKRER